VRDWNLIAIRGFGQERRRKFMMKFQCIPDPMRLLAEQAV